MEIPTELRTLFSAEIDQHEGSFVIEIPQQEVDIGAIQPKETYRVAILPRLGSEESTDESDVVSGGRLDDPGPPVEEGERRTVEIEHLGDQGDGITRVERGFVVIVSDASPGEKVTVEITHVQENVAFADVVDRPDQFE
jgi:predicted RNA-binding protein with TRAM domain